MKIFANRKASRLFSELHSEMSAEDQSRFGAAIRKLADDKITGDGDEFYVTERDVAQTADNIRLARHA